jgi:CheY-like chemotaxis protein
MTNILVVDDDSMIRRMLCDIIEVEGYSVADACNGREAIHLQRQKPADLLITDLIMPELNGFQTIETFRTEYPWVKIIAISGSRWERDMDGLDKALALGAHKALTKPFKCKHILTAVKNLLNSNGS